ncbi:MAG: sigma-70 family RNA polymerase sigma factor [Prosthecobacter sp.]|nr:sigma-70 family RNA polymerase sigma factor [Prosthecobacter sp.]
MPDRRRQLERLYDAHGAGLFRYLQGFVRCEADAKDLLQELFIRLASQPLPGGLNSERAFLWRIAHNLAVDWLRRRGTRDKAETTLAAEPLQFFQTAGDPDAAEFARHVEGALAELPLEQRSVAQMKLWDGLTFEEIATVQGIPLNTAASRYRYALDKLRARLRPLYEEIQP